MEKRVINYLQSDKKINVSPESIPTLLKQDVLNKWTAGDAEPYYKIQAIEYPIMANGLIYEESFFDSFINKSKDRPIPGSKTGHETSWGVRPPTDLVMVGGKLESNGDGSGVAYFKNYIPKDGNELFIKENQSDMIHYSLVAYCKEIIENDSEGNTIVRIVESMKGERNDAVEYGTGAMKQVTNSEEENGEKNNRGDDMDKAEMLKKFNSMRENGDITLFEIAKAMNLEDQIIQDVHRNALEVVKALKEAKIEDPVKEINSLKDQIKSNDELVFNSVLTENFGAEGTEKEPNLVRNYAQDKLKGLSGDELEKAVNALKVDPIAKKLVGEALDPVTNSILIKDKKEDDNSGDGPIVARY